MKLTFGFLVKENQSRLTALLTMWIVCVLVDQCVCVYGGPDTVRSTILSYYRPAAGCLYLLPCTALFTLAGCWATQLLWHCITASVLERALPPRHSWVVLNFRPLLSWRQVSPLCNPLILFHQKFIVIKNAAC